MNKSMAKAPMCVDAEIWPEGSLEVLSQLEVDLLKREWPETEVLILRPDQRVLELTRGNPMSVEAAIPAFLATLRSMRDELAHPSTWSMLERHIVDTVNA